MLFVKRGLTKYHALPVQLKASFWFLLSGILQRGVAVLTTPIFTRLLTPSEFGVFSLYLSWFSILSVFVTLKLSMGVYLQGLVKFEEDQKKFTSSLQGLSFTAVGISFIIYIIGQEFWNEIFQLSTLVMVCMFVSMWSSAVFGFWSGKQRVDFKYKALVRVSVFIAVIKPVIGIVVVLLFPLHRVEARILSITIIEFMVYFIFFVSQLRKGKQFYNKEYWKYALKFNIPLIPHYLSQTVLSASDKVMIGMLRGAKETGIYSLAYSLSMLMTIINVAIDNTMGPWIYKNIKNNTCDNIGKVSYAILIVLALSNLLLIGAAPEVIAVFAPPAFHEAMWVIPPVSMGVFFMFMYSLFSKFAFYFEKTKTIMVVSMIGAVLNIALNLALIPRFGYLAAAYTTLLCYMVYVLGHYFYMRFVQKKYMNNTIVYNPMIIILISAVFMVAGFGFTLLYEYLVVRYLLIAALIVIMFIYREKMIGLIKEIRKE